MTDRYDHIPDELKQRDQWLLWDSSNDAPRRPHWQGNFDVSWSNPSSWHSFEEAVTAANTRDSWGIGYVTAADNPDYARGLYGVIDIDGCATDDQIAKDWVPSLKPFIDRDAYIEWSPSGTGLHIPVAGIEPPDWWRDVQIDDHEGIDVLTNKFCTFTGDTETPSGNTVVDDGRWLDEWLREAQKSLTGDDPYDGAVTRDTHRDGDEWLTEDDIRDALTHIDPDDSYEHWRDIGFALADFFDNDQTAYKVFRDWSQTGTKWDDDAPRLAERIIEDSTTGGGRTIGTVIHHAQQNGWELPDPPSDDEEDIPDIDPEEVTSWAMVRDFYEVSKDEVPDKQARQAAASKLLAEYNFAAPVDTERLWIYDSDTGVYEHGGKAEIEKVLARNLGAHYSQHEMREIVGKVRANAYIDRSQFDAGSQDNLVCVKNGVLDLDTRDLRDHDPEHYFTRALPVRYDPDADAPAIESFLEEITRRDADKQTLVEMVGHALRPRYEPAKFLIVFGEGANGKSTFFDIVEQLLGGENVAGWELQSLSENRFAAADLVDKYANVAPDMPATKINELGTLKTLTGEDQTMAERKGEQGFEFTNHATLMFGANRPPAIMEASTAIKRRLVPVRLPYEFTHDPGDGNKDAEDRNDLVDRLTTGEELSGFLNLALDGLDRLLDTGDVSLPETRDERLEYYQQFSDPIKQFRVTCLTNERGVRETKAAIYNAYTDFCRSEGYSVKDGRVFWRVLRQTTLTYDESRPDIGGERVRVLNDVKFTPQGLEYAPEGSLVESREAAETNAVPLTEVGEDDQGLIVEGRVTELDDDQAEEIAAKATLVDESGERELVFWNGAPVPVGGGCYRFENVYSDTYKGAVQVYVSDQSAFEEIQDGVGNAPSADAGANAELADGGYESMTPQVYEAVVGADEPVTVADVAGSLSEDPGTVEERLEKLAADGRVIEESEGYTDA